MSARSPNTFFVGGCTFELSLVCAVADRAVADRFMWKLGSRGVASHVTGWLIDSTNVPVEPSCRAEGENSHWRSSLAEREPSLHPQDMEDYGAICREGPNPLLASLEWRERSP